MTKIALDDVTRRAAASAAQEFHITNVSLCSADVHVPVTLGGSDAKRYRAAIMIPVADPAWEAVADQAIQKTHSVWRLATGKDEFPVNNMISRGEEKRDRAGRKIPGLEGTIILSASNMNRPLLIGEGGAAIEEDDGSFYAGATVHAILKFYPMLTGTMPGVYAELLGLKHLRHGQAIGFVRKSVSAITAASFDGATAAGAGMS